MSNFLDQNNPESKYKCKNELIYIRDFEAVQKTRSRVFIRCKNSRLRIYLQNLSKLTDRQMDKVRRIVHPKLKPLHFQIKTYYLSDINYPTDNPSLV